MFQWLQQHPKQMNNFNVFMSGQRHNRVDWFDSFPVDEILLRGSSSNSQDVLLLDIAGGHGHDLETFKKRYPNAPGKLILQDLPPVIADIGHLEESIVRMDYDFFTSQPVIGKSTPASWGREHIILGAASSHRVLGARAYYFRSIFHDWPDHKCQDILRNVVKAMTPGYSKLLINEYVLPDVGVPLYPALLDINMMALLSGMERTETQWKELLASVGLRIVKIWSIGHEDEALIEAIVE